MLVMKKMAKSVQFLPWLVCEANKKNTRVFFVKINRFHSRNKKMDISLSHQNTPP